MKLELKHLAPYLSYNLQMRNIEDKTNHKLTIAHQTYDLSTVGLYPILREEFYKTFKPILRPLSDLTKEIEVNGQKFVPIEVIQMFKYVKIDVNGIVSDGDDEYGLFFLPYLINRQLFEWHFDVFGLIEKGLAIDINTLNK